VDQKLRQIEVKLNAMHQRAGGAAPQTAPKTAPQAQPAAPSAGHILKYNPKTGGFE
jgi:hypothetical protein